MIPALLLSGAVHSNDTRVYSNTNGVLDGDALLAADINNSYNSDTTDGTTGTTAVAAAAASPGTPQSPTTNGHALDPFNMSM